MTKDCLLPWARRRLRWLLCVALLLPLAQLAGAAHAYSHLDASAPQQRSEAGPVDLHCGLCLLAAAADSAGLPCPTVRLPGDLALIAPPVHRPVAAVHLAPQSRPCNRGPPSLLA